MIAAEQCVCPGCGLPFTPRSRLQTHHTTGGACKQRAYRLRQHEEQRGSDRDDELIRRAEAARRLIIAGEVAREDRLLLLSYVIAPTPRMESGAA